MYYYTALLITVSLQLATRHFGKYLVALGTNLFFCLGANLSPSVTHLLPSASLLPVELY
jgi:hypothetical protein